VLAGLKTVSKRGPVALAETAHVRWRRTQSTVNQRPSANLSDGEPTGRTVQAITVVREPAVLTLIRRIAPETPSNLLAEAHTFFVIGLSADLTVHTAGPADPSVVCLSTLYFTYDLCSLINYTVCTHLLKTSAYM
jgi:hypothetical protein